MKIHDQFCRCRECKPSLVEQISHPSPYTQIAFWILVIAAIGCVLMTLRHN